MIFRFMHTRPKIFMFCLDLKPDNKNCSSVVGYYNCFEVISMNFQLAYKVSAITSSVAAYHNCFEVISMNF